MKIIEKTFYLLLAVMIFQFTQCTKEVSSTSPDVIYEGKIVINSNPQGAKIFFENENTGKLTPDSLTNLSERNYLITLKHNLFLDTLLNIYLVDQQRTEIYVDYYGHERNYGKIFCSSEPQDALIFLDDSCTGLYTPSIIDFIWPGDHEIKFTYPEHRADSVEMRFLSDVVDTVYMALQDTSIWVNYNENNSNLTENTLVSKVAVDHNNMKWVGSRNKGLFKFDGRNWIQYSMYNSPLPWYRINSISIDQFGRKWIGTQEGLAVYDDINWTVYNTSNSGLPNNYVNDVAFDSEGNAWIGASAPIGGRYLVKFDGTSWTVFEIDDIISTLEVDPMNNVWIGTAEGLIIYDGENWIDYRPDNSDFFMRGIESVAIEDLNNVWIGAWPADTPPPTPGGLFNYNGFEFSRYLLPTRYIRKVIISDNGEKWIAAGWLFSVEHPTQLSGGLIKVGTNGEYTSYVMRNFGLHDEFLDDVAIEDNGDVWTISSEEGLIKVKSRNF